MIVGLCQSQKLWWACTLWKWFIFSQCQFDFILLGISTYSFFRDYTDKGNGGNRL